MSSADNLLKATVNRLSARLGQKLVDTAAEITVIAQDAPEKIKKEWELFEEEVIAEANRLSKESSNSKVHECEFEEDDRNNPQTKIDDLRAKVATLNRKIEEIN